MPGVVRRTLIRSLTVIRLARAEVKAHRSRTVAAVLTVALGAGVLTMTLVLSDSLRTGMTAGLAVQYSSADVVLTTQLGAGAQESDTGAGSSAIPTAALRTIRGIAGVSDVAAFARATAVAQAGDITRGITLESLPADRSFVWQRWARGRAPRTAHEVGLTQTTLDQLGVGLGDRVALGDPRAGRQVYTVTGVVDVRGALSYDSSAYGVVTAPVAQAFAGIDGPDVALVRTAPGVPARKVIAQIDERAPVGFPQSTTELIAAERQVDGAGVSAVGALAVGLAGVSLVVAAVTSATATAAAMRSRRRTLALARCIGAERQQVLVSVFVEVLAPSILGALLGVACGILLARALLPLVGLLPDVPALHGDAFTVTPLAVVAPLLASAVLATATTALPAWLASRIPPSEALAAADKVDGHRRPAVVVAPTALVIAGLGAWIAASGPSRGHPWMLAAGAVVLLVGAGLLLSPALVLAARVLRRAARTPAARIALGDVQRRPSAAAVEAVAIVLAVGVMAMSWVCLSSMAATTSARLTASPLPDLTIGAPSGTPAIAASTQRQIAALGGVARVVPLEYGTGVTVEGNDDAGHHVSLAVGTVAADPTALGKALPHGFAPTALRPDTIYLPTSAFSPFPAHARVTLRGPDGSVGDLAVVYVKDLAVPSAVAPALMRQVSTQTQVRSLWVDVARGADRARVLDQVTGAAILGGELPVSGPLVEDVRVGEVLGLARWIATGILAVAVLVAVVGASATASLTVRERTREYAVMRALGLERTGLRRLLLTRMTVVGSIAAIVGALAGTALGLMIARAIATGLTLPAALRVPALPVVLITLLTVLVVRAATLTPLEQASYVPPSRALAKE